MGTLAPRARTRTVGTRVLHLVCVLVALGLGALPAHADRDKLVEGRKLSRSKEILERLKGVRMLAESDEPGAIQPLEDAIRACTKDMDRLAKDLDKLDEDYTEAVGYWNQARASNSARFYDLAKRYYELVKAAWNAKAVDLVLTLQVMQSAGEAFAKFRDEAAIAVIQESGLKYEVDALGTTVEGTPDAIWALGRAVHEACLRAGADSLVTVIKVAQSREEASGATISSLTSKFR